MYRGLNAAGAMQLRLCIKSSTIFSFVDKHLTLLLGQPDTLLLLLLLLSSSVCDVDNKW